MALRTLAGVGVNAAVGLSASYFVQNLFLGAFVAKDRTSAAAQARLPIAHGGTVDLKERCTTEQPPGAANTESAFTRRRHF